MFSFIKQNWSITLVQSIADTAWDNYANTKPSVNSNYTYSCSKPSNNYIEKVVSARTGQQEPKLNFMF